MLSREQLSSLTYGADSIPSRSNSNSSTRSKKSHPPLQANLTETRYPVVKRIAKELQLSSTKDPSEWDLFWTDSAVQPQTLARMRPHQKINHFPGMFNLSRKNYLARNVTRMAKQFPKQYAFHPKTWLLPSQYAELKRYLEQDPNSVVIAKPQASCQGRGIFLSKSIDDFGVGGHYVVQKYLKKPYLIDGLKFDLRVYVLVAGCDPLRIYVYRQGLARFATQIYCPPRKDNLSNLFMHLTNYAINKSSDKFQGNVSTENLNVGHKRALSSVMARIQNQGGKSVWQQICGIITKTVIAVQPTLSHHYRSCQPDNISNNMCFEILGFDIILDQNFRPYVLEVNYTPSFTTDSPLDTLVKEALIRDTLILINLTSKAKAKALALKKRELMQRTLTGKKSWQNKQEREEAVQMWKAKRDRWEQKHLGNFVKVYPAAQAKQGLYKTFLQHAQTCYLATTGGNIIRNTKVSLNSHLTEIPEIQAAKPSKYTNTTDQLQKIYIKKPKQMMARKLLKNDSITSKEQERKEDYELRQFQRSKPNNFITNPQEKVQRIPSQGQRGEKRGESMKNGRTGLSKIYNVTFKEMKVK